MCHFISATFPKSIQRESIQEILDEFQMDFSPLANANIIKQIPSDLNYVRATGGHCDCGTLLGSGHRLATVVRKIWHLKKRS